MGDADIARNMVEDPELASLFDEALTEVDEEMDRLFSFINFLHARTSHVMSQMSRWQKFCDCFAALNLLVIPVILAIGIAYVTVGMAIPGSTIQSVVETLVTILMYLSAWLGLPLYVFTLYEVYFKDIPSESESGMTLASVEESLETIVQFRALSRARRSQSQLEEVPEDSADSEESAGFDDQEMEATSHQLIDLNTEKFEDATHSDVTLFILNASGCEVEVVKNDEVKWVEEIGNARTGGVRNIPIENVGEGDTSFAKDTCDFVEIY